MGEDIKKNGLRIPIVLEKCGPSGRWRSLVDGRNRLDAMELVGLEVVRDGKLNRDLVQTSILDDGIDPFEFVISANIHRRHLSADDKRKVIATLLKAKPEKSNRQIAETAKVSHVTVGAVRAELESTGQIDQLTKTVGKDGKTRRQLTRKHKSAASTPAKPAPARAEIGPTSAGENARRGARIEELRAENRRLEIENVKLRSEVEDAKAARKPLGEGEGNELLGALLRAWDRASEDVRKTFMARVGLVAAERPAEIADDGLDIPQSLRRAP